MKEIAIALEVVNLGIKLLTSLQVGAPILQRASDTIAAAIRDGRQVSDAEVEAIRAGAEEALKALEAKASGGSTSS